MARFITLATTSYTAIRSRIVACGFEDQIEACFSMRLPCIEWHYLDFFL